MSQLRLALTLIAAVPLLFLGVVRTSAAPINSHSPNLSVLPLTCSNGQTYTVVVPGTSSDNSKAAQPAHIIGSTSVLVPKTLSIVGTENGQVVFSQTLVHGGNASFQGSLLTCMGTQTFTDPFTGGTVTVTITGTAFLTPR